MDTTIPETTITSGPATGTTTGDATPTFELGSSEPGSTFQCRVDTAAFATCTSPVTTGALTEGAHTFDVRSIDVAGNTDPTPATSSFTVDTTIPETTITSGPAMGTTTGDTTPTFGFSSTGAGATFTCSVDGAVFGPCSGPGATHTTAALAFGTHTFSVRATNAAGNTDLTPALSGFSVVAPSADCSPYSAAVAKAKAKVAKAKTKLKKAKKSGNPASVKKAKAKLKKAKKALKEASAALTACQAG